MTSFVPFQCHICGKGIHTARMINGLATCDYCVPRGEDDEIALAINTLWRKGVTPEMYKRALDDWHRKLEAESQRSDS